MQFLHTSWDQKLLTKGELGFEQVTFSKWIAIIALGISWLPTTALHAQEAVRASSQLSGLDLKPNDPQRTFDWNWKGQIFGRGVSDQTEESRNTGLSIYSQVQSRFSEFLDADASGWLKLETGSTHSLYEINRVRNGVVLDQARVRIHPIQPYLSVSAGALNQRFLENPLLLDEVSFPAVHESLEVSSGRFTTGLTFQQAIPTSTSLSTKTAEKEPLPYLLTENAFLKIKLSPATRLGLRVGHFAFNDLPSQVAFESFTQGNIVDATVPEDARFASGFSGYTLGADFTAGLGASTIGKVGADLIHNSESPTRYANGTLVFTEAQFTNVGAWSITPRFEYFRNERQTSPAYYNSADYGHNNRHGFSYELKVASNTSAYAFKGRYTDAALIESDPLQANSKIFMLYLEISSDVARK